MPCQHRTVLGVRSNRAVEHDDLQALRLRNLQKLKLGAKELSDISMKRREVGRVTFWADVLRGTKKIGERLARLIEDDNELPRGWMDRPDASVAEAATPFAELNSDEATFLGLYRQLGKVGGREEQIAAGQELNLRLSRANAEHADPQSSAADPFAKARGTLLVQPSAPTAAPAPPAKKTAKR